MIDKDRILKDIEEVIKLITCTDEQDFTISAMNAKIETISEMVSNLVKNNARTDSDEESFTEKYNKLKQQYDDAKCVLDGALKEKAYKQG